MATIKSVEPAVIRHYTEKLGFITLNDKYVTFATYQSSSVIEP